MYKALKLGIQSGNIYIFNTWIKKEFIVSKKQDLLEKIQQLLKNT